VRWHPELGETVATLHVARQGRKGRHLLVFRVSASERVVEVLRILHDSMDLSRHLDS
jgi:toxin ParE1/3/4